MKILAIDTSSNLCSVALLENTKLIKKIELNNGLTHSETLMPLIKQILEETNLKLKDIDLLVSDVGPGSFTGIRIGVATCKAFSDSLNIPTIGISSLEVLAYSIKNNGLICSTKKKKNDNCYCALYKLNNGVYNIIENPCAKSNQEVIELLKTKYNKEKITFVGNGITSSKIFTLNNKIKNSLLNFDMTNDQLFLNVENLGIAGYNKFINNSCKCESILPLYLKKPQAEVQLELKQKNNK